MFTGHLSRRRWWWPSPGPGAPGTPLLPLRSDEGRAARPLPPQWGRQHSVPDTRHFRLKILATKKSNTKQTNPEEAGQVHCSSASAGLLSKAGAQRVPDTPLEMLSSALLGGRLSLSAANAFIFLRKKTYLSLIGCIWTNWFFSVFWTEWTLVFPLISASTSWLRCTQGDQAAIAEQKLPPFGLSYQAFPCLWQELHSYQEKK